MLMQGFGTYNREPLILMIGTFDPFLPSHQKVLQQMKSHGSTHGVQTGVVLLDPNPCHFLEHVEEVVEWESLPARMFRSAKAGIDYGFVFDFTHECIDKDAFFFLNILRRHLNISELWLGSHQTLGSGPRGSITAIRYYCERAGIALRELEESRAVTVAKQEARAAIQRRDIETAQRVIGHPALWSKPKDGFQPLAWPAGHYRAAMASNPDAGRKVEVELEVLTRNGKKGFYWPDEKHDWLVVNG